MKIPLDKCKIGGCYTSAMFGFRKLLTFTPRQEGSGMALFRVLSKLENGESNQIFGNNVMRLRPEPRRSRSAYSGLVGACTENRGSLVLRGVGICRGNYDDIRPISTLWHRGRARCFDDYCLRCRSGSRRRWLGGVLRQSPIFGGWHAAGQHSKQ